jgi:hypothetical protein
VCIHTHTHTSTYTQNYTFFGYSYLSLPLLFLSLLFISPIFFNYLSFSFFSVSFPLPQFLRLLSFLSNYILFFGTDTKLISLPCSVPFFAYSSSVTPYIRFSQSSVSTLRFPFTILCVRRSRIVKLFSKME